MNYLTYEEYVVYYGGICDENTFTRNIDRACSIIDSQTQNRVKGMVQVPRAVKVLCRDLVEYLAKYATPESAISSLSQTAGTVSQSITYAAKNDQQRETEMRELITDYLLSVCDDNGTPLLYKGVLKW